MESFESGRTNEGSKDYCSRSKKKVCFRWKLRQSTPGFGLAGITTSAGELKLLRSISMSWQRLSLQQGFWKVGSKLHCVRVSGHVFPQIMRMQQMAAKLISVRAQLGQQKRLGSALLPPPPSSYPKGTFTDNEERNAGRAGTQGGFN